ncbi:MAG: thiamine pyrophosphate-dependent dehydrogenase E1 component subunit alpha [Planctomycetes bacterium]|nr:thiamine pyrophosphate-dependent dehydrogenase E1 component subunit alpha [Planctomycetota bacterium]
MSERDHDRALDLYRRMLRIRLAEEGIVRHYAEQEMRCPVHLHIGQEAVSAGVCAHVEAGTDRVFGSHRCHGPYLALGGSLEGFFGELHGKESGCCRGRGGSMHLIDKKVGFWGSSAIVAGTIPIAVGAGMAIRHRGERGVSIVFFGDGAVDEGVFSESVAFAALKQLPVLFVCENNLYATLSPQGVRQALDNIPQRAEALGCPGVRVDGNDANAVHEIVRVAAERAREGRGPTLIEARTYRWYAHVGPAPDTGNGARSTEELERWRARCPIARLEREWSEVGQRYPELAAVRASIELEVSAAIDHARRAPEPSVEAFLSEARAM